MTKRSCLLELAERCERATEPSRELDKDIALAMDPKFGTRQHRPKSELFTGPCWTESVDAALTLAKSVPGANCHGYDASPKGVNAYVSRNNVPRGHWLQEGHHPTEPALALCAAALKALASQDPEDD